MKHRFNLVIAFVLIPSFIFAQNTVVIFDFVADVAVDGELSAFLQEGSSNLVRSTLANHLTVVERKQMNQILKNTEVEMSELFDQETVIRLGKMAGAKYSVMGSWIKLSSFLTLTIRLVDNERSIIVASEEERVNLNDIETILDLPSKIATRLLSRLDVTTRNISRQTNSMDALISYSQAVQADNTGNTQRAEAFAKEALAADPGFEEAKQFIAGKMDELVSLGYRTEIRTVEEKIEQDRTSLLLLGMGINGAIGGTIGYLGTRNSKENPGLWTVGVAAGFMMAWFFIDYFFIRRQEYQKAKEATYYIDNESGDVINEVAWDYIKESKDYGVGEILPHNIKITPQENGGYLAEYGMTSTREENGREVWTASTRWIYKLLYINSRWRITLEKTFVNENRSGWVLVEKSE